MAHAQSSRGGIGSDGAGPPRSVPAVVGDVAWPTVRVRAGRTDQEVDRGRAAPTR